jgi:tetratricopeptide (TPR) repeat protein
LKIDLENKGFALLFIIIAILIAYCNVYQNAFLWDDEFLIQKNTYIRSWNSLAKIFSGSSTAGSGGVDNFYRPIQGLVYTFVYNVLGHHTWGYHFANIILHILCAISFYFLAIRLGFNKVHSLLASVLWGVHPVHTEAVTYMSATADPSSTLFVILSILVFDKFLESKKFFHCIGFVILNALAIISKESVVITPVLMMLIIFWRNETRFKFKTYLYTIPAWLLTALYFFMRSNILNFNKTFDMYKTSNLYTENILYRVYTFLATLPEYTKILFAPYDLRMERSFPVYTELWSLKPLLGLSLVLLIIFLVIRFWKVQNSLFNLSWGWFFVAFIPMSGILIPVNSFILEHWLHLPSLFLFLGLISIASKWSAIYIKRQKLINAFYCIILVLTTAFTLQRNTVWKTPISFYSNILQYNEGSARVHNNLAMAYSDRNNIKSAIKHYKLAIELSDSYPQTNYNLARIYIKRNEFTKAINHLNRSIEIDKNFYHAHLLLSKLYNHLKETSKSKRHFHLYKTILSKMK